MRTQSARPAGGTSQNLSVFTHLASYDEMRRVHKFCSISTQMRLSLFVLTNSALVRSSSFFVNFPQTGFDRKQNDGTNESLLYKGIDCSEHFSPNRDGSDEQSARGGRKEAKELLLTVRAIDKGVRRLYLPAVMLVYETIGPLKRKQVGFAVNGLLDEEAERVFATSNGAELHKDLLDSESSLHGDFA